MFVKCVIDRPELDGVRTYDFDPLGFTVTEGPPPTTVEVPTELVPPLTVTNPVQVQGEQITRPDAGRRADRDRGRHADAAEHRRRHARDRARRPRRAARGRRRAVVGCPPRAPAPSAELLD